MWKSQVVVTGPSHSVFSRLLFPAFVAPAMTTCTPLRSRSPLRSSFRCRSISAWRSNTAPSTVRARRDPIKKKEKTGYDIGFCVHFLGLVRRFGALWSSGGVAVTSRLEEKWVINTSLCERDESGKLKIQTTRCHISCWRKNSSEKTSESLEV